MMIRSKRICPDSLDDFICRVRSKGGGLHASLRLKMGYTIDEIVVDEDRSLTSFGIGETPRHQQKKTRRTAEHFKCAICISIADEAVETPCAHIFCGECLRKVA